MHPTVKKAYDDAHFQHVISAHDNLDEHFHRIYRDPSTLTPEERDPDSPKYYTGPMIKERIINKIVRISKPTVRDHIIYSLKEVGHNAIGGKADFTDDSVGRYEMPDFEFTKDQITGNVEAVRIASKKEIYEIPYSRQKMRELLLEGKYGDTTNTKLYLDTGHTKYTGFAIEDFVNLKGEDLVRLVQDQAAGQPSAVATTAPAIAGGSDFRQRQMLQQQQQQEEEHKARRIATRSGTLAKERIKETVTTILEPDTQGGGAVTEDDAEVEEEERKKPKAALKKKRKQKKQQRQEVVMDTEATEAMVKKTLADSAGGGEGESLGASEEY